MREYLLVLFCTAAVTYLLTGPVRKFAILAGAMPPVRARDVHREPTPGSAASRCSADSAPASWSPPNSTT